MSRFTVRIGSMYLAPRKSIAVSIPTEFLKLTDEDRQCGTCTLTSEKTFVFKLCFLGSGSLESAWVLYRALEEELNLACDSLNEILFRWRVRDETELVYRVVKARMDIVDAQTQFICDAVLCVEVKLTLVAAVVNQRVPSPIGMRISFPRPVVTVATSITPTPIASTISFPATSIQLSIPVTPLVLDTAFPGHQVVIAGSPNPAGTGSFVYIPAKQKLWSGQIDLDTDDIRCMLLMTSTTADTETSKEFINQFTTLDEFNGAGYVRQVLTNEAVNADAGNSRAEFDADDPAFGALSNGTRAFQGAMLFKFVTNDTDSIPLCWLPNSPGANVNPGGSTISLQWSVEGIMWHV